MSKTFEEILENIISNVELETEVGSLSTVDEVYDVFKREGYQYDIKQFEKEMSELFEKFITESSLSESELDNVAGGTKVGSKVVAGIVGSLIAGSGFSAMPSASAVDVKGFPKDKCSVAKKFVKEHPAATAATAAAVASGAMILGGGLIAAGTYLGSDSHRLNKMLKNVNKDNSLKSIITVYNNVVEEIFKYETYIKPKIEYLKSFNNKLIKLYKLSEDNSFNVLSRSGLDEVNKFYVIISLIGPREMQNQKLSYFELRMLNKILGLSKKVVAGLLNGEKNNQTNNNNEVTKSNGEISNEEEIDEETEDSKYNVNVSVRNNKLDDEIENLKDLREEILESRSITAPDLVEFAKLNRIAYDEIFGDMSVSQFLLELQSGLKKDGDKDRYEYLRVWNMLMIDIIHYVFPNDEYLNALRNGEKNIDEIVKYYSVITTLYNVIKVGSMKSEEKESMKSEEKLKSEFLELCATVMNDSSKFKEMLDDMKNIAELSME